jgi:hypothetical protein
MSIGIAIFASVVLVLLVYNKPFRKVFFWIAGISAVIGALIVAGVYLSDRHTAKVEAKRQAEQHAAAVKACIARLPVYNPIDNALCDIDVNTQPALKVVDSANVVDTEKVTCDLLRENAPNDYLFDGFGHCTPKHKTSAPKIMATIRTSDHFGAITDCTDVILWDAPSYMPERRALVKFKGGEVVEYVGEASPNTIVRYHGIRGYADSRCVVQR